MWKCENATPGTGQLVVILEKYVHGFGDHTRHESLSVRTVAIFRFALCRNKTDAYAWVPRSRRPKSYMSYTRACLLRSIQCDAKAENWQEAATLAQTAIKEFPNFSLVHEYQFYIARGLEADGLLNDAIQSYRLVIDSPQGSSSETAAIAQWRIGEIRFHQEDYPAAIQAYHRVDSIFGYPKWRSAALLQAGKCQEHLKNWKHAEKLYRQLLKSFPDNELATDAQGRLTRLQSIAAKTTPDKTTPNHTTR